MARKFTSLAYDRAAAPPAARMPDRKAHLPPPSGPAALQIEHPAPARTAAGSHLTLLLVEHENAGTMDWQTWRRAVGVSGNAGPDAAILHQGPEIGDVPATLHNDPDQIKNSTALRHLLDALVAAWTERAENAIEMTCRSERRGLLSEREGAILKLIAEGRSNKEIARNLSIAPETVKSHVKRIFMKLNAESRAQAVARAQSLGLLAMRRDYGLAALPMAPA